MLIAVENSFSDFVRLLIAKGADIQADNLSDEISRMVFIARRPLLLFLKAVSMSEDLTISRSLRRVAVIEELVKEVVTFL